MLHAIKAAQGLLQHPVAALPAQMGQEAHTTCIFFSRHLSRCRAVAMGPNGARRKRHKPEGDCTTRASDPKDQQPLVMVTGLAFNKNGPQDTNIEACTLTPAH